MPGLYSVGGKPLFEMPRGLRLLLPDFAGTAKQFINPDRLVFPFDAHGIQLAGHKFTLNMLMRKFADNDVRAVFFIEALQPRAKIDVIAHDRVIEAFFRSHVANGHCAGIDADADVDDRLALPLPYLLKFPQAGHHIQRAGAGANRMIRLFHRRSVNRHNRISHIFVKRSVIFQDDFRHLSQIRIQEHDKALRLHAL